ncbi:16S rRNA (cytosine(1402)-N(4))-methyltransferase RsmH [Olsenella sp. HMSC062G07]|uniref:16S rRNA (cytosine(1402)-N(4))-methyltransferase RsmH n=1 Tax=Olsenella sp. HMSC062G07 TaxID=1739330 RepID=UPI0008A56BB3|nr:16S rRNA (cytosine(1402)-N(4))-methyltransferase RsmH [Olsenella sp. HMSC062G07]OFK24867.1 16S rRNA (cytosine(1402)-N(4))-methyltransferase [Olsenella sp. HMSC062G07]
MTREYRHEPVMIDEVVRELGPRPGEVVCDCTLGGAGHSIELARRVQPDGLSIGIDQDDMALTAASARFETELPQARTRLLKGNFGSLDQLLVGAEVIGVDCFLFDLGVSSPQLDIPERGFSYNEDAPLDMRMDPDNGTLTAAEVTNTYNEADLVRILRMYGDERFAPRIARLIVRERERRPIETTLRLAQIVKSAIPAAGRRHGGHPARKTFQALRIEVNHELEALDQGLRAAVRWANAGGRIAVISYHSLEDRIVKHVFHELSQGCVCPPDLPVCACGHVPIVKVRTKRPLVASDEEVAANPRSRSALLRVAVKLDVTST